MSVEKWATLLLAQSRTCEQGPTVLDVRFEKSKLQHKRAAACPQDAAPAFPPASAADLAWDGHKLSAVLTPKKCLSCKANWAHR